MKEFKHGKTTLLNCDCMEYMAGLEDNAFDLAACDVPYGINANKMQLGNGIKKINRGSTNWDDCSPNQWYFKELFRVSKNQILWGANHFIEKICKNSSCWIFWDKGTGGNSFADGELAWTSFGSVVKKISISWVGANAKDFGDRIHCTQKPVALYKWIFANYAKPGQRILDTHGGSFSSAIAAHYAGLEFVGMELDPDYYTAAVERFKKETRQIDIFQP